MNSICISVAQGLHSMSIAIEDNRVVEMGTAHGSHQFQPSSNSAIRSQMWVEFIDSLLLSKMAFSLDSLAGLTH